MSWKQIVVTASAAFAIAGFALMAPSNAQARGSHRGGRVVVGGDFFIGPGFGWGWGWGPFYHPYGYLPYGPYAYSGTARADLNAAAIADLGAVDLHVKPGNAEVWVDGKYVAEARNLDGDPSYLWLKEGAHKLSIRKGGYESYTTQVDIRRGVKRDLKVRLRETEEETPATERPEATS
jgi:hypothetical protein